MTLSIVRKSANSRPPVACATTTDALQLALLALGAVSILFAAVPELDLIVSRLFWSATEGFAVDFH